MNRNEELIVLRGLPMGLPTESIEQVILSISNRQ